MYLARLILAAEGIVVDRDTNSISVFNILDRITAEGFPLLLQKMALLVIWERSLEDAPQVDGQFSVHFSGRELYQQPVRVEFTTSTRNQFVLRMHGLVIPQPGVLSLRITLEHEDRPYRASAQRTCPTSPCWPIVGLGGGTERWHCDCSADCSRRASSAKF